LGLTKKESESYKLGQREYHSVLFLRFLLFLPRALLITISAAKISIV